MRGAVKASRAAVAVLMAGGQGERFWPMTHKRFPKYLVRADGRRSFLTKTYARLRSIYPPSAIFVVTTASHAGIIRRELRSLRRENVFVEPERRNTAAAIFFACEKLADSLGEDAVASFFPVDHLIRNEAAFKKTLHSAIVAARRSPSLITIGIRPTFPATGYGYILAGGPANGCESAVFCVARFVEKPDLRRARRYVRSGRYLWNGGIFTWRLGVFRRTMRRCAPGFHRCFDLRALVQSYRRLPRLSIDKALLEKAPNVLVCRTKMDWCDMGSWDRVYEKSEKDSDGNFVGGLARVAASTDSLILNRSRRPLVALGLHGTVVVQTERGTLVCRRGTSEEAAVLFRSLRPAGNR